MYQHYRKKGKIELISISGRDDETNKKILEGEYIQGERNELLQMIFSDWIGDENDYLYIGDTILKYPIYKDGTLREKSLYERYIDGEYILGLRDVILNETIHTLSDGQYVEDGEIKAKDRPQGDKIIWDYDLNEWIDLETIDEKQLKQAKAMLEEYKEMDSVSIIEEMKQQNPSLPQEFIDLLINLRKSITELKGRIEYNKQTRKRRSLSFISLPNLILPTPSDALKQFKDKFKEI